MTTPDFLPGHDHSGFVPDDVQDPLGRPVNYVLLCRFVAAAVDSCVACQQPLMDAIVADPTTATCMVELACVLFHDTFGGLTRSLVDDTVPGDASPEFRRLARAGLQDEQREAMFAAGAAMSIEQRRAAVDTAADLVIGNLLLRSATCCSDPLGSYDDDSR